MPKELLHIYGPIAIQSYGTMIALGLLLFIILIRKDKRITHIISDDLLLNTISLGIVTGVVGGRTLFALTNWGSFESWYEIFEIWLGGFQF